MNDATPPSPIGRAAMIRFVLFLIGSTLMVVAPIVGLLPGPGGLIVFALGLGLALKNSAWAKRRYVDFKRRFPKPAEWADWGMRRPTPKRRAERSKQQIDPGNG